MFSRWCSYSSEARGGTPAAGGAGVADGAGTVSFAATVAVHEFAAGPSRGRRLRGLAARRPPPPAAASRTAALPPPHVVGHRRRRESVARQRALALCAEVGVAPRRRGGGRRDLRLLRSSLQQPASLAVGRRDDVEVGEVGEVDAVVWRAAAGADLGEAEALGLALSMLAEGSPLLRVGACR